MKNRLNHFLGTADRLDGFGLSVVAVPLTPTLTPRRRGTFDAAFWIHGFAGVCRVLCQPSQFLTTK